MCLSILTLSGLASGHPSGGDFEFAALAGDDECQAADGASCALNALQVRAAAKASASDSLYADQELAYAEDQLAYAEAASLSTGEEFQELLERGKAWRAELLDQHNLPMPTLSTDYDGISWPRAKFDKTDKIHVFAIGDWGGLQKLDKKSGKNVRDKTAPNARHHLKCPLLCDYVKEVDEQAQMLVAHQVKARAASQNNYPEYFLNVGDNFYWAGTHQHCGTVEPNHKTLEEFQVGWVEVYGDLTNIPWLSTLGNHDYGGFVFTNGWDAQIGYSFINQNWVMPARYFSRVMEHPGFSIEYFMIDSNVFDAHSPEFDIMHNLCSTHNGGGATCASSGGPKSTLDCEGWFHRSWQAQKQWLETKLAESTADWQVVVTHFPCGHDATWYRKLHEKLGLDLLVTGHRHDQELWPANMKHGGDGRGALGGLTCFVTGGGGGVTSENTPHGESTDQYGFFDLTISKESIFVELVNIFGKVLASTTAYPVEIPTTTTSTTTKPLIPSTTPERHEDQ